MIKLLRRLRNYLISGLLFWIPLILTIVVIKFFLEFINSLVPKEYLPEAIFNLDTSIPGSGIILLFIIILITGVLVTNILGRRLVALWEKLLNSIPGFRNIYNILKKVSDTVLNTSSESFKKAYLIQYPNKGIWVIAFQSGDYQGEAKSIIGEELINLFLFRPLPTQLQAFYINTPKKCI